MTVSPQRDPDRTIASIYRAASGAITWAEALEAVVRDLDGLAAQMVAISRHNGAIVMSHANANVIPEAALDYVRVYHAHDPRIPLLVQGGVGEWIYCQDHFDDDFAASNPYYRDLLIPYGGRYSACVKLAETPDESIMVEIGRAHV